LGGASHDAELQDARARLARHYETLETRKLDLDDLAPLIKEIRLRQYQLQQAKVKVESEMALQGVKAINGDLVRAYAQDLLGLLEKSDLTEQK